VIDQLIPVGIRGPARHLRCAAWLAQNGISRCVTPQQIAQQQAWRTHPLQHRLPPLIALKQLAPIFEQLALCWGITGATGFELASGITALRPDSDLDLNIICPEPVSSKQAQDWLKALHTDDCRIDLQLETPYGAVALVEWARGGSKCLLKTNLGPFLVADPWAAPPLQSPESQV
jgi:phosphoribosyl-dephospho-CoA transferase